MSEAITWKRPQIHLAGYIGDKQVAVVYAVNKSTDFAWWHIGDKGEVLKSGRCATEGDAKDAVQAELDRVAREEE